MVLIQNNVLEYFDELIYTLFEDEYFGFVESSEDYINRIINFIKENYKTFPPKKSPTELQRYGSNYLFYKINPKTTWYIFFEKSDTIFIVTHIFNNHAVQARYL